MYNRKKLQFKNCNIIRLFRRAKRRFNRNFYKTGAALISKWEIRKMFPGQLFVCYF